MTTEELARILAAIDHDKWKNSWNLKRNQFGEPDMTDLENLESCRQILQGKAYACEAFATECRRLIGMLDMGIAEQRKLAEERA